MQGSTQNFYGPPPLPITTTSAFEGNFEGATPLDAAVQKGHTDIVTFLRAALEASEGTEHATAVWANNSAGVNGSDPNAGPCSNTQFFYVCALQYVFFAFSFFVISFASPARTEHHIRHLQFYKIIL